MLFKDQKKALNRFSMNRKVTWDLTPCVNVHNKEEFITIKTAIDLDTLAKAINPITLTSI